MIVLRKFGVEKLFDVVIAMEDYPPEKSKPDPYPISLAVGKLGTTKGIYVGDSVDDIIAAKRAGVKAIGCVSPGVCKSRLEEVLLKCGAETILKKISDIDENLCEAAKWNFGVKKERHELIA